jgi:hypothetical protein
MLMPQNKILSRPLQPPKAKKALKTLTFLTPLAAPMPTATASTATPNTGLTS